jgi:hypothetical protein
LDHAVFCPLGLSYGQLKTRQNCAFGDYLGLSCEQRTGMQPADANCALNHSCIARYSKCSHATSYVFEAPPQLVDVYFGSLTPITDEEKFIAMRTKRRGIARKVAAP